MVGLRTDKFRPIGNPLLQAVSSLLLRSPRGTRRIGNGYGNGLPATALGELVGELGPDCLGPAVVGEIPDPLEDLSRRSVPVEVASFRRRSPAPGSVRTPD